ncbi:cadmium/peroxide/UV radiation responsive anti-sigma factor ChrR [Caulobacter segnis]
MSLRRLPSEERLLAYAAGTLSPPEAVVVATHLALRPQSRAWTQLGEAVGGAMLDDLTPLALEAGSRDDVLARLDMAAPVQAPEVVKGSDPTLPEPLRHFALSRWRWVGPGVQVRDVLGPRDGDCRVIMLRIAPGQCTPVHTHGGVELTCVIEGAYATDDGVFELGDFEEADPSITHQQRVVSPKPCLCVAALDGQIQLPGRLGRWLAPFVKL